MLFQNYTSFNEVQKTCLDPIFSTQNHLIIRAPPGAGKTCLFELSIVNTLQTESNQNKFTIIYGKRFYLKFETSISLFYFVILISCAV